MVEIGETTVHFRQVFDPPHQSLLGAIFMFLHNLNEMEVHGGSAGA